MISLVLLLTTATPDACKSRAPTERIAVHLKAGMTLDEVARVVGQARCEGPTTFPVSGKRAIPFSFDGELFASQLPALLQLAFDATGASRSELPFGSEPAAPACDAALIARIVPVDPWTRKITAAARDAMAACLPSQLRAVPAFKGGVSEGLKIFGIRQGSIGEALAFQNGDTLLKVNGLDLTSAEKAIEVYSKLKTATDFTIELNRNGELRTIRWQIR